MGLTVGTNLTTGSLRMGFGQLIHRNIEQIFKHLKDIRNTVFGALGHHRALETLNIVQKAKRKLWIPEGETYTHTLQVQVQNTVDCICIPVADTIKCQSHSRRYVESTAHCMSD